MGLFGQFITATVKNLTIDGAQIYGSDTAGGFIGNTSTNSKADNCHVKNLELVCTSYNVGGITVVVLTGSELNTCSSSGSVVAVTHVPCFSVTSCSTTLTSRAFGDATLEVQNVTRGVS